MKKVILVVLCFTLLSASALFISCSNKTSNSSDSTANTTSTASTDISSSTSTASSSSTTADNTSTTTNSLSTTDGSSTTTDSSSTTTDSSSTSTDSTVFTADTLSKYDGQNGNPAYIAIDGVVYDVSNADRWRNGKHETVSAGMDLTDAFAGSPHDKSQLDGLPIVGTYK